MADSLDDCYPWEHGVDDGERYYNLETLHDIDFRCLCKRCQHNYAMTPQDNDLLRELGIIWGEVPDVHG